MEKGGDNEARKGRMKTTGAKGNTGTGSDGNKNVKQGTTIIEQGVFLIPLAALLGFVACASVAAIGRSSSSSSDLTSRT